MKDYRQLIEEKYTQIILISGNSKEIIDTLNELVETNDLDLVRLLPFCDFLIELLLAGDTINKEDILKYYDMYSKTLQYNSSLLNYVFQTYKQSLLESVSATKLNSLK